MVLTEIFEVEKPVIGMVHLNPLPSAPLYSGEKLESIKEKALKDLKALEKGGVDGFQIENFGDRPFRKEIGLETVSFVTSILESIKKETNLPHGLCLLMSGKGSLAVAKATGGDWIRSPYFMEVYASYVGLMEGEAASLQRFRKKIGATDIYVFADVHVKHAQPLLQRKIESSAKDAVKMGLADAIIVSGKRTGEPVEVEDVKRVKDSLKKRDVPVILGSGASERNIEDYWPYIDGIIVGTSLKKGEKTTNPVDAERVKVFMRKINNLRGD